MTLSARVRFGLVAAAALMILATVASPQPTPASAQETVPVIFVHGFVGSGAQYQSQAMRFASDGYPADYVRAFEYNSLNSGPEVVQPALDAFIDGVRNELGADQVYVLAHSLGTSVMQGYLNSSPERAARVAKYVNLDGATADAPPGGVPTLAIWGAGNPAREVTGAENAYFPDQTHTQVVTSPESFAAQYEFLVGEPPATTNVEPEANVEIAGRAVLFPENVGIEGATLQVWAVDGTTGHRIDDAPVASYLLDAEGSWGPLPVSGSQRYEFLIIRPDPAAAQHHIYMQAFTRSNYLIRLLSVPPDSPIATNIEGGEQHSTITVIRYKEWWGNDAAGNNDTLEVDGVNVINPATSPVSNRTIGIHMFDRGSDGVTNLAEPDEFFFALPFQTGVDIFMGPSTADPPDGTICLTSAPRGDQSSLQRINVPNWRSSEHRISMEFTDYVRVGDPACSTEAEPTPTAQSVLLPDTGSRHGSNANVATMIVGSLLTALAFGLMIAAWRVRAVQAPTR